MVPSKTMDAKKSADTRSKARLFLELNRLHKFPAGIDLVFWPCAWALAMGSYRKSRPLTAFIFDFCFYIFASTLVHSAGCVLNDILDRELDAQVERTKNRPIACGAISVKEAVACLSVEVLIGLAILASTGDLYEFIVGVIGIFPLGGLYPLMKRYTNWPQAWLGLAMNWGFVVVWIHHVPEDKTYNLPAAFLAGAICWTLVYDTIYACQDRVDDIKAGNYSTAILFGTFVKPILSIFAAAFVAAIAFAGKLNDQGPMYYLITVGGTSLHLLWQLGTLKVDVPADCWQKFKSNGDLGWIIFAGMAADYLLKA